jgi:hypothetical protein
MTSSASTARLSGRYLPRTAADTHLKDSMFVLLHSHFMGVTRETFEADLLEKNWVILLEDEDGALRGFSTLLVYEDRSLGRPVTIVYSGDTIVSRDWWGSSALPLTWLRAVREIVPLYSHEEAYWLLITSGFRTYRFLPVFFREFYPSVHGGAQARTIVDRIARARFGPRYDEATGIVTLQYPQVLVPELVDVPENRAADPHIANFVRLNPGFARGDELVCIARISDDNLTPAGRRMARSLEQQR